ncbi:MULTISPECIES: GFA family protein [Pseudoalteromonas]|uniref:GFA family protein n=1 Tax=Pseudoalteromonas TaxID=53246 RepID=UPI001582B784|nr:MULTISPECIES: GFA family protein [Pseudoalteromonas]MDI4650702.1 GFA family protein [Pseudoalteromonas shioyasakiensis]NUJ37121.1 GFA family protein [Pseudoalteromonas sp. 0303]
MYQGSCLCGKVKVTIAGGIDSIIHCHCSLCRKNSGTAYATNGFIQRDGLGITVSYWQSLDAIKAWKQNVEHLNAQQLGRDKWYSAFTTRIAKVERDYSL